MSRSFIASQLALTWDSPCRDGCRLPSWCGEHDTEFGCQAAEYPGVLAPGAAGFLQRVFEVAGLDFRTIRLRGQDRIQLPDYLPQVDGWSTPPELRSGTVGLGLARLMNHSRWPLRSRKSLAQRMRLTEGSHVVLLLAAKDRDLERKVWPDRIRLMDALSIWAPEIVITPGFSVWPGRSALEHRYAQVRDIRMLSLLRDRGFVAVPTIGWARSRDLDEWASWLIGNSVANIAVDAQCTGHQFAATVTQLSEFRARFEARFERAPDLLVNGLTATHQFAKVLAVWPNATFTSDAVALPASGRSRTTRVDGKHVRVRHPKETEQTIFGEQLRGITSAELAVMEVSRLRAAVGEARASNGLQRNQAA